MSNNSNVLDALIQEFPYEIHQIRGPNGELVWVQRGINPDNIFEDKRKTEWPFSAITADLICQKIAEGSSLSQVCKLIGFPPYTVVCRWRRENIEFAENLEMAYKDRTEFYRDKIIEIVNALDEKDKAVIARLQFDALKWCVDQKAGPKKKNQNNPEGIITVVLPQRSPND